MLFIANLTRPNQKRGMFPVIYPNPLPPFNQKDIFCEGENANSLQACEKIWLVILEPSMWKICMPNFRPLALLIWPKNEVTDGHVFRHLLCQFYVKLEKIL